MYISTERASALDKQLDVFLESDARACGEFYKLVQTKILGLIR
jgi:hypothetical protein